MIAQSVAEILNDHVTLKVEGIDRMYLNVYVPTLQHERGSGVFPLPSRAAPSVCGVDGPDEQELRGELEDFWRGMRCLSCSSAKGSERTISLLRI